MFSVFGVMKECVRNAHNHNYAHFTFTFAGRQSMAIIITAAIDESARGERALTRQNEPKVEAG